MADLVSTDMVERLKLLENNVIELLDYKNRHSISDINSDKSKEWALRYGFLETIQIVIDISCHLVAKYNLGNPATYSECIDLLIKHGYIDSNLADKLYGMVGLRNILVHEYIAIEAKKLYNLLDNVGDFKEFADKIKGFI